MAKLASRFRRLDDALYDLAIDEAMLLSELDGFLTGLLLCPDRIMPAEWLPYVWANAADTPFEDPDDTRWFTAMLIARRDEIGRDLTRLRPQPVFDRDERTGEVLWEPWVDGFATAVTLRPDCWPTSGPDAAAADAFTAMTVLIEVARNETSLTSIEINDLSDLAAVAIPDHVMPLHDWCIRHGGGSAITAVRPAKTGRNDPCPCGSGGKFKRCCGAT